jgi:SAM-dependent methyltransferase
MTREQRLVFGEDAELYDRARPGYSDAVVTSVLEYLGDGPAPSTSGDGTSSRPAVRALEIGAGTGKGTVAFAARGAAILAVEPDPAMAAVAARHTAAYPGVRIEHSTFEELALDREPPFDLVFSAQAWHWVQPEVRTGKAAAALRPGGALALFWHRPHWPDDDPLRAALDACYVEHAPGVRDRRPTFPGVGPVREQREHQEVAASELFTDLTVRHHPWTAELGVDDFLALLATQSDHRLLPEATRDRLFAAVRGAVAPLGRTIRLPYDTLLVLGRRIR